MNRSEIVGRGPQVGLVVASAAVPGTFARSLSDRTWVDQGIITGLSTVTQYVVSVFAQDGIDIGGTALAGVLPFPESWTPEQRRRAAILLLDVTVVPVGFGLAASSTSGTTTRSCERWSGRSDAVRDHRDRRHPADRRARCHKNAGRTVGASGRIARFPVGVPGGVGDRPSSSSGCGSGITHPSTRTDPAASQPGGRSRRRDGHRAGSGRRRRGRGMGGASARGRLGGRALRDRRTSGAAQAMWR